MITHYYYYSLFSGELFTLLKLPTCPPPCLQIGLYFVLISLHAYIMIFVMIDVVMFVYSALLGVPIRFVLINIILGFWQVNLITELRSFDLYCFVLQMFHVNCDFILLHLIGPTSYQVKTLSYDWLTLGLLFYAALWLSWQVACWVCVSPFIAMSNLSTFFELFDLSFLVTILPVSYLIVPPGDLFLKQ